MIFNNEVVIVKGGRNFNQMSCNMNIQNYDQNAFKCPTKLPDDFEH